MTVKRKTTYFLVQRESLHTIEDQTEGATDRGDGENEEEDKGREGGVDWHCHRYAIVIAIVTVGSVGGGDGEKRCFSVLQAHHLDLFNEV